MNDRIKELARQAGLIVPYGSDREGLRDFDYRQFAKLIALECAKIAEDVTTLNQKNVYQYPVAESIKKQFGVE